MHGDRKLLYILNEAGEPVSAEVETWSPWMATHEQEWKLAVDIVGDVKVSTVFLGSDHNWGGGPPILWETCIFTPDRSDVVERYMSREQALSGHAQHLADVLQKAHPLAQAAAAANATLRPKEILAHGYVTSGPHAGAQVTTFAVGVGWQTLIHLPSDDEPTLWGRYQDRASATRGHDAAMTWAARAGSPADRPGHVDEHPADEAPGQEQDRTP